MKTKSLFTLVGLLCFILLCFVPSGYAQQGTPLSFASAPAQIAQSWTFTSSSAPTNAINVSGLRYWQLVFVPSGTVSACGISFDSSAAPGSAFSTGGIIPSATIGSCATAGSYNNSTGTTPTILGQLTPTVTGSGSVTVALLGYVNNPAAAGSTSSSISSPVDGSGNVKVNCAVGCSAGTPGQQNMAGSQPVVLASNQSAVSVNTQPAGFGALIGFQQAVTASAVALASNAAHSFCVTALPANTINIYVGPSGVTTSTGTPLVPGQSACFSLSNTNLVFVIASTTGASVSVSGV